MSINILFLTRTKIIFFLLFSFGLCFAPNIEEQMLYFSELLMKADAQDQKFQHLCLLSDNSLLENDNYDKRLYFINDKNLITPYVEYLQFGFSAVELFFYKTLSSNVSCTINGKNYELVEINKRVNPDSTSCIPDKIFIHPTTGILYKFNKSVSGEIMEDMFNEKIKFNDKELKLILQN